MSIPRDLEPEVPVKRRLMCLLGRHQYYRDIEEYTSTSTPGWTRQLTLHRLTCNFCHHSKMVIKATGASKNR